MSEFHRKVKELYDSNENPDDFQITIIRAKCAREEAIEKGGDKVIAAINIYLDELTGKNNI